jgi:hypothetical protein
VTQWTPNTAVANWTTVDETPPSATDYNSDATAGHQDLYALGRPDRHHPTVFAVQSASTSGSRTPARRWSSRS